MKLYNYIILINLLIIYSSEGKITLDSAIKSAINKNNGLHSSALKVKAKDELISSAKGKYLPNVNFDISYNLIDKDIIIDLNPIRTAMISLQTSNQVGFSNLESILKTGNALNESQLKYVKEESYKKLDASIPLFQETVKENAFPKASLSFSQPIFTGGKITSGVGAAEAQKNAEEFKMQQERNELVLNVIQSYINVIISAENLSIRKSALQSLEKHKARAEKMYNLGLIANHDKLRADVAYSEAIRNLSDAEEIFNLALEVFNSNASTDIGEMPNDSLLYKKFIIDKDEFTETAFLDNPIIGQTKSMENALIHKSNAEFANYLPTIYGFGTYDLFDNYRSLIEPKWVVGIAANFNIFNGFKRTNDYQASESEVESAKLLISELQRKISLGIKKYYMEMKNAEQQYKMLEASLKLAEESFILNEKRYETGLGTSIEVLDAHVSLEAIKLKRLSALKDFYFSIANLYFYKGNTEEFLSFWNN